MDSTQRFSNRVADYIKYRPSYPPAILDDLARDGLLTLATTIADIGSGTGIFSKLLLDRGYSVIGVEPNAEMRRAAEELFAGNPQFTSVAAPAEATTLGDQSVDLIVSAQAFHWFDRAAARKEFARILRPGGRVVLIWNERLTSTAFLAEYDALITRHAIDYVTVDHRAIDEAAMREFFAPAPVTLRTYPNEQRFNFESLKGRVMSSSYMPPAGHPHFDAMIAALAELYQKLQCDDGVTIDYETKVYIGNLG